MTVLNASASIGTATAIVRRSCLRLPAHVNLRHCGWSELTEAFAEPFEILSHTFKTETYVYEVTARLTSSTGRRERPDRHLSSAVVKARFE